MRKDIGDRPSAYVLIGIAVGVFLMLVQASLLTPRQHDPEKQSFQSEVQAKTEEINLDLFLRKTIMDPVAAFTGVLAILTFCLVVISVFQGYMLIRADGTAGTAAYAAKESADTSKNSQRAFLTIKDFRMEVSGPGARVHLVWENNGATPAYNFKSWISLNDFTGDIPEDFNYPDFAQDGTIVDAHKLAYSNFLGPKGVYFTARLKIPIKTLEASRNRKAKIFIWGWAEYNDAFELNTTRRTEFCYEIAQEIIGPVGPDGKFPTEAAFVPFGRFNSAS